VRNQDDFSWANLGGCKLTVELCLPSVLLVQLGCFPFGHSLFLEKPPAVLAHGVGVVNLELRFAPFIWLKLAQEKIHCVLSCCTSWWTSVRPSALGHMLMHMTAHVMLDCSCIAHPYKSSRYCCGCLKRSEAFCVGASGWGFGRSGSLSSMCARSGRLYRERASNFSFLLAAVAVLFL